MEFRNRGNWLRGRNWFLQCARLRNRMYSRKECDIFVLTECIRVTFLSFSFSALQNINNDFHTGQHKHSQTHTSLFIIVVVKKLSQLYGAQQGGCGWVGMG